MDDFIETTKENTKENGEGHPDQAIPRRGRSAKPVALAAGLAALVTLATMLSVPVPGFRLYFNFGEGIIYATALLLGPRYGAAAGGIGAALGDLILGYPLWAPLSLVIKGVEGFLVGRLAHRGRILALGTGAAVMTLGYTSAAALLFGAKAAPVELLTDCIQTGMGALFALAAVPVLSRRTALITGTK
jgi:uncharacterized membrane protein